MDFGIFINNVSGWPAVAKATTAGSQTEDHISGGEANNIYHSIRKQTEIIKADIFIHINTNNTIISHK